jgi:molecular chaperone GrpE
MTENSESPETSASEPKQDASASPAGAEPAADAQAGADSAKATSTKGASAPPPPPDPLAEAKAEAARMKDQWVRTAADFDNYRKRARREVDDARKSGREEMVKEMLPTFDNLERAIQSAQRATEVKPVAEGLSMVVKQFVDVLGRAGISKIATVGKSFDPMVHEAIQQVETDDHPPGTIVSEIQAGYMQGERLVRAAMVVVAKPRSGDAPAS